MRRLKVVYHRSRCVGQGSCAAAAPEYFEVRDGKSVVLGKPSVDAAGNSVFEKQCSDKGAEALINAGLSCPVNAIQVVDADTNKDIVPVNVEADGVKEIIAEYDDASEFVIDSAGYFLIRVNNKRGKIEVAFCSEKNKIAFCVVGSKPIDIYHTIINKLGVQIRKDHAAYLGRELQKAYIALTNNIDYVQDEELISSTQLRRESRQAAHR